MAKIGTLAHYKQSLDALDAARRALEASGADPNLIDGLEEAAHAEALSGIACNMEHDNAATREWCRREGVSFEKAQAAASGKRS